jgi:glycosyltransferase involved in cell wall biosynthesis
MTFANRSPGDATPLRFCFVTTFYPPWNRGGDGVVTQRLANALARRGHHVTVVHDRDAHEVLHGLPADSRYEDHPHVEHRPIGGTAASRLDLVLSHQVGRPVLKAHALRQAIEGQPFDVIHYHNVSLLGGPGVLTYGRGVRLVTLHDYWFVCPMHVLWRLDREACKTRTCFRCTLAGRRPPQLWRSTSAFRRAIEGVDAFLTGSEFARRKHHENGFPAPIQVLPPFVPAREILAQDEPSTIDGDRYFLFVGRLERYKGVADLVESFRRFRAARLVIVGTGTLGDELRARARDLDHVEFAGPMDRDRLLDLYAQAVALIVPSLCYETFGVVAVEAMARGTPVIARDGGALREVVEATGGGVLYEREEELESALRGMLDRPDWRRELGERGRRAVLRYSSEESHLGSYLSLVHALLGARAARPPMATSLEECR